MLFYVFSGLEMHFIGCKKAQTLSARGIVVDMSSGECLHLRNAGVKNLLCRNNSWKGEKIEY